LPAIDHRQADQLKVVVAVGGQRPCIREWQGAVEPGQPLRRTAVVDTVEYDQQAAVLLFGLCNRHPPAGDVDLASWREPIGKVGEELHSQRALDAVRFQNPANPKIRLGLGRHTISTITRSWFFKAAARTTARMASMLRPPRPMTLPTSSLARLPSTRLVRSLSTLPTPPSSPFA